MDYEKIKQLIEDVGNSKLSEIEIDFPDGTKISMKKEEKVVVATPIKENKTTSVLEIEKQVEIANTEQGTKKQVEEKTVTSPMVGTFYSAPSPKDEPYVKVGDIVKKGDVLCVVEAMKLMNELESEFDGEIVEICVKNEEMVEYGTTLFKIK